MPLLVNFGSAEKNSHKFEQAITSVKEIWHGSANTRAHKHNGRFTSMRKISQRVV